MAKQIKLSYEGKDYVLEYSRKSVEQLEAMGFDINTMTSKLATNFPLMFSGAFIMHHRALNPEKKNEIFNSIKKNKSLLSNTLIEMISEVYNSLFEDEEIEDDEDGKKSNWEIV